MKKLKRGDVREDGMVFDRYDKSYKSGEYWTTKEQLLKRLNLDRQIKEKTKQTVLGHAKQIFTARKNYSFKNDIEFNISFEELTKDIPKYCPILGIKLLWCEKTKVPQDGSPSIDKFDPEQGYVPGNVFWVSYKANRIKNNATLQDIEALRNWMIKITNESAENTPRNDV